ncbi:MAG: hypothetical protein M3R38_29835 [Actinomycetota bacterium]|nr:hypothetical protein [Actinomycetota bacterium]
MTFALAVVLVTLAVAQLVALLAVVSRHAIPRSPRPFHVPLALSIPAAVGSAFVAAYVVQPYTPNTVLGLGFLGWLFVFFLADAVTYWTLNVYALAWHLSIRHRR